MKKQLPLLLLVITCSTSCAAPGGEGSAVAALDDDADNITADSVTPTDLYTYRAAITDVYDGDTVTADIDLGFHVWIHGEKLRLSRINAPEVRGEERPQGLVSRDWLREKIGGKKVIIKTLKSKTSDYDQKGKYGRYLAEIYLDGENINDALVENGLAEYREY